MFNCSLETCTIVEPTLEIFPSNEQKSNTRQPIHVGNSKAQIKNFREIFRCQRSANTKQDQNYVTFSISLFLKQSFDLFLAVGA